jgi:hypothetical protein
MFRNTTILLIYHRHKLLDFILNRGRMSRLEVTDMRQGDMVATRTNFIYPSAVHFLPHQLTHPTQIIFSFICTITSKAK